MKRKKGVCLDCVKYDKCDVRKLFGTVTYCDLHKNPFYGKIENILKKCLGGEK